MQTLYNKIDKKQCSKCKQWKNQKEFASFELNGFFPLCHKCWSIVNIRKRQKRLLRVPKHRITRNLRTGIYKSLHTGKGGSWEKAVGYTLLELKTHLENQFMDGMSWDNHGEWHIDHIKPISDFSFQSTKDSDFKRYWALSNLQPLWAKDNWYKNKKSKSNWHKHK
jgi:hypothetical protein